VASPLVSDWLLSLLAVVAVGVTGG